MPGSNIRTDLFEAYQESAHDMMPPGFVLAGETVIQTIGNVRQLFSESLPSQLANVHQLPDGHVKSRLLKIVKQKTLGNSFESCFDGVRVTQIETADAASQTQLLVVFDVSVRNPTTEQLKIEPVQLSGGGNRCESASDRPHPFFNHLIGPQEAPRVIIWETDHQGDATYISDAEEEFTGCSQEELLGLGWTNNVHADDLEECMVTFRQAIIQGEPFCFTSRRRRFDGKYFWFTTHGVPQFNAENVLCGFKGFCLDCTQQLEVQSALAANQRMMCSVLDNSPYLSAFVDRDLKYQYANYNYAQFWDVSLDRLLGMSVPELTGTFYEELKPFLDRALTGETVFHELVVPGETVDASQRLEITHVPAFDANESVVGFYCFVNDVTESRKHDRLLKMVLNHTPAMILLLNTGLEIRHANSQFVKRMVRSGVTVMDRPLIDVLGHDSVVALSDYLQKTLAGEKCSFEASLVSAHGGSIDIFANFVPEFDDDQNVIGICGLMLDISELRTVQSELQRSEARFELAVAGSSMGIFELDSERPDWIYADHIEDLLGFDRGELNNSRMRVRSLLHPDELGKNSDMEALAKLGETVSYELRLRNKNGQYRWFEAFSQPIDRADRGPGSRAGTLVDINDLKSAQLESAAQVRRRDEFLAMLSHELRNPMAAIVLSLDLFKESGHVPTELKNVVDIMLRRSSQISRLLDDLLDVSRVTHNRIEFNKNVHDLNLSVAEVAAGFVSTATHRRQTLHVEICADPLIVEGDESRLKQVITNLIENALKYSPEDREIWVSTQPVDGSAVISVRDSGIGISRELIGHIFDLFVQGDASIHRTSGGMGVGLFMVNHIVNAHKGVVVATSEGLGLGSQFDVCLPLSVKAPLPPEIKTSVRDDHRHVVIVDDNGDVRNMASQLLEQRGYQVSQFADGESASQRIPEICPDIAIIDIGLPGKSGLDLAREFRSNPSLDKTMLIALTGYGQASDRKKVASAGFDLHLVKPTDIEALTEAIADWTLPASTTSTP